MLVYTALEVFEEAEQINTEDRDIHHNKGLCYLYLKQYDVSIECFQTANSIQRHEKTYIQLGICVYLHFMYKNNMSYVIYMVCIL